MKDNTDSKVGTWGLKELMWHYFVAQIYMSGLASQMDIITSYPSSKVGKKNAVLGHYTSILPYVFRLPKGKTGYLADLLIRHRDAPESKKQGDLRHPFDQLATIIVNPSYKGRIEGRHIVVVDDYTTAGYSFEAARVLLEMAGACRVTGVAFGKFRAGHDVVSVARPWDPFAPSPITKAEVSYRKVGGTGHPEVDDYFFQKIYGRAW